MRRSKEFQPAGITGSAGAQGSSRMLPRSRFAILSEEALLLMLITVSRQSMLQLFCQLLPAPGGQLHRLLGRRRAETIGFRSDLFRH